MKGPIRPTSEDAEDSGGASKTQLKKAMLELQSLGEALVDLPAARLARLSLPEDLRDAVMAARRITAHGGKRRQLQYVGRLMRALDDAQVAALRQALAAFTHTDAASTAQFHTLERWRARLLDDEAALTDWLQQHPQTDAQRLRALIRKARRERSESLPPAAFRELFQLLKQACET